MYPNLNAEMARIGLKSNDIANLLCVSQKTAYNKITGRTDFDLEEAVKIQERYFPSFDIRELFSKSA